MVLLALLSTPLFSRDILISFDGSCDISMWQETLKIAKEKNVKFTYFISAPYFVTKSEEAAHPYWGIKKFGYSPIKFRKDTAFEDDLIKRRFCYLKDAIDQGCEIGSHLDGHYSEGNTFTYAQWTDEFNYFKWAIGKDFDISFIKGIRAPALAVNSNYFKAVNDFGYVYDSSVVAAYRKAPPFDREIYVNEIKIISGIPDSKVRHSLVFDYNFDIFSKMHPGLPMSDVFFNSLVYDYEHGSGPFEICLHFEKFEGQPYYNAMLRFIDWVADKNPNYLTYNEYFKKMKALAL